MSNGTNIIVYIWQFWEDGFDFNQCLASAASGYAPAQYEIGQCYKRGWGVKKDFATAIEWFNKAVAQGYAPAQRSLGYCYENGEGVPQDWELAGYW